MIPPGAVPSGLATFVHWQLVGPPGLWLLTSCGRGGVRWADLIGSFQRTSKNPRGQVLVWRGRQVSSQPPVARAGVAPCAGR